MSKAQKLFAWGCGFALAAAISYIHIWQYVAELTGEGLWIGLGAANTIASLYHFYKSYKLSNNGHQE